MGYTNFENSPNTTTPLSAQILNQLQRNLMEMVFPIGSTYITQDETNPVDILEFGTWERLKGKVCLGIDEDDTNLNTIGNIGGEKEHTLTIEEMPNHRHGIDNYNASGGTLQHSTVTASDKIGWSGNVYTNYEGDGQSHNNMQPYEVVGYMWIRRA